jgi:hypothetical protein
VPLCGREGAHEAKRTLPRIRDLPVFDRIVAKRHTRQWAGYRIRSQLMSADSESDPQVRLSSDYLYHFKKDIGVVKLILRNGFRYSSWSESIPFFNIRQNAFVVCFCDIRPEDSGEHRACYGQNAIVLNKAWGVRENICPVRYVHRTSPGVTPDYIELKTLYRSARKLAANQPNSALLHYLVLCDLYEQGVLVQGDFMLTLQLAPQTAELAQRAQKKIKGTMAKAASAGIASDVEQLLDRLMNRIHQLHNELEKRDSYMRAYEEDFKSPATGKTIMGKRLYDEKEWRSIKFLNLSDTMANPDVLDDAAKQGFLPSEHNLRFSDEDVHAILTENRAGQHELQQEIESGTTLLTPSMASRVFVAGAFREGM